MPMPVRRSVSMYVALASAALSALVSAGAVDRPTYLGMDGNWAVYVRQTSEGKVCYAQSTPVEMLPRNAKRGEVTLLINDWPSRRVRGEVQVAAGYPYREGAPVTVSVGDLHVEFFSRNDRNDGFAWVKNARDESSLRDAMRMGARLTVEGMSKRGTRTKDTYSLKGVSAALDKIHGACGW